MKCRTSIVASGRASKLCILLLGMLITFPLSWAEESSKAKFSKVKTFKLFSEEAHVQIYKNGQLEETNKENAFQNGEIAISILGSDKALFIGTHGSSELPLVHRATVLCILETTLSGTVHTLHIFDTKRKDGYFFIYHRTVRGFQNDDYIVSTFHGVAKPWD